MTGESQGNRLSYWISESQMCDAVTDQEEGKGLLEALELGDRSLALAAKLVRQEASPTLDRIKELTLTAFKKFYRTGAACGDSLE